MSVVNLAAERERKAVTPDDWTPRELVSVLGNQSFPNGLLVAWIDDNGLVQIRRSQLDRKTELDILRAAGKRLLPLPQE